MYVETGNMEEERGYTFFFHDDGNYLVTRLTMNVGRVDLNFFE